MSIRQGMVISWDTVDRVTWTFKRRPQHFITEAFELTKVADFSSSRFRYLGEPAARPQAVVQRQMQMLRQLHALGPDNALALRIVRASEASLRFLIIVRLAVSDAKDTRIKERLAQVENAFPKEYALSHVSDSNSVPEIARAFDLSWASFADELLKPEPTYPANGETFPFFYVPTLVEGQALNDMDSLCRALLRFQGNAVIDLTLTPTALSFDEREWVANHLKRMREAQNGERIIGTNGRELRRYDPMPGLRIPVENYENLLKRYDPQHHLFLYAFRVFADADPESLSQALITGGSRSKLNVIHLKQRDSKFLVAANSASAVDIAPEIHLPWWDEEGQRPFSSQRLHRLMDVEEATPFWRFPIPMHEKFPGVTVDRGLEAPDAHRSTEGLPCVTLGSFADETASKSLPASFEFRELTRHGLIVGVPGSGKTTLMFNLLHQLWQVAEHRVPFMVLEPAKTEYRGLKAVSLFSEDLLVFTLGDERISPFRFNPFEVPRGISLESHISRLKACFVAAFDLFDPLPMLLDQAIRDVYEENGWTELAVGGAEGCGEVPTMADLHAKGKEVAENADYAGEVKSNIRAALDLRLASLLRGSKGYMLNTRQSISPHELMKRPVILELDALNQDEKALLMMFLLTFVYEHAKSTRLSGSPLSHILVIEEAHNLIGRATGTESQYRANPKTHAIDLFVRMLAEMRALGEGILIADQLPTALAPEAMKNTNFKVLMRLTALDDRLEIGNTMGLGEKTPEIEGAVHLRSGNAYVFLEDWDRVRLLRLPNYKHEQGIEQPQTDESLQAQMLSFQQANAPLYMPFSECALGCSHCDKETRSAAKWFVRTLLRDKAIQRAHLEAAKEPRCERFERMALQESRRRQSAGEPVSSVLPFCLLLHLWHEGKELPPLCSKLRCECEQQLRSDVIEDIIRKGKQLLIK